MNSAHYSHIKTPTASHPIRVKVGASVISVETVFVQLGHVRVQGWVRANNKAEAFAADGELAARLGLRSIGSNAYGATETDPVSCPFSFDIQNEFHPKYPRRESLEETLERTLKALRSARYYFSRKS